MNKQLYNLAKRLDDINYEYDTYNYMDNLDTTDIIEEAREKEVIKIYNDLTREDAMEYIEYLIEFLDDIIDNIEGYLLKHVQEVLEELKKLKGME